MRRIEIHIVRHKQIELTIAVVVQKTATCAPAVFGSGNAGLLGYIGESAVAIVVVENVASKIGDEEIVEAVVVVVADTTGLSPAGAGQAGLFGDIGEGAVTIVVKQIAGGIAIPDRADQGWFRSPEKCRASHRCRSRTARRRNPFPRAETACS